MRQHTEEIEKLQLEQENFKQKTKNATEVASNLDKERERICNDQDKVSDLIQGLTNAEKAVSSNVRYSIRLLTKLTISNGLQILYSVLKEYILMLKTPSCILQNEHWIRYQRKRILCRIISQNWHLQ